MKKANNLKAAEIILLALVWVVLIAAPLFFRADNSLSWTDVFKPLHTLIPLFFVFLINRFILVPRLLFKKRNLLYILSVITTIGVFTLATFLYTSKQNRIQLPPSQIVGQRRLPPPPFHAPDRLIPPPPDPQNQGAIPPFANLLIFSVLLIGFDTGLKVSFRLTIAEKEKTKLEKENVESQLAFLRNQVSPHFFMNTLNNIHSLIDIDVNEAKESIIRLSKLMRHLLYDSEIEHIPIQKELDFIKNYVDLMKLRYSDKVIINLTLPDQLPDKKIPPLLFTSFLENAFKHGISYQQSSYININISCDGERLMFEIKNSHPEIKQENEAGGIGIENSRKRLDLIYGDNYQLNIADMDNEYTVKLNIPI